MLATVVVVDWRQPELTRRCLRSLSAQVRAGEVEVVLVVNEATAGQVEAYRTEFPSVHVVPVERNLGFAGGVARGLEAVAADVVVLLNNDAVAEPGFVRAGLAELDRRGPSTAAVAATVVLEGRFELARGPGTVDDLVGLDGRRWRRSADGAGERLLNGTGVQVDVNGNGADREWLTPLDGHGGADGSPDPFGFSGGAVFLRRSALDEAGGFDESLFMYYEDVDVSWRLRLAGYDIGWAPAAVVVHRHAGSSSSSGELVRYQSMRNRLVVVVRVGSVRVVARVLARTALRCARDLLPGGTRQLAARQWARLLAEMPRAIRGAVRARRLDGRTARDRGRVEGRLLPTVALPHE